MKGFLVICAFATYTTCVWRYGYILGIKESYFDREQANAKLEQCSEVFRSINESR